MLRRPVLLAVVFVGCGSSQTAQTSAVPTNHAAASPATDATTPAQLCERARQLRAEGCAPYDRVDPSILESCSIVDGIYIAGMQDCLQQPTCAQVSACSVEARRTGAAYRGPTAPCASAPRPTIPAGVSAAELEASYGRADRRYSDSPSTKDRPIEVCGLPAQSAYLLRLTCDDGSHPFASSDAAAGARVGNVGEGGRCGRIIDEYEVACPERVYQVFIDAYRCPA